MHSFLLRSCRQELSVVHWLTRVLFDSAAVLNSGATVSSELCAKYAGVVLSASVLASPVLTATILVAAPTTTPTTRRSRTERMGATSSTGPRS